MGTSTACTCKVYIEVDNKRALAILTKAWEDFEALWPEIEAKAKEDDAETDKRESEEMEARKARRAARAAEKKARDAEYERAHQAWAETWWFRGPEPMRALDFSCYEHEPLSLFRRRYELADAIGFRRALKQELAKAQIANAPYRMTEADAQALCEWECGDRIEYVRGRFIRREPGYQPIVW